jgi:hypothetical protein
MSDEELRGAIIAEVGDFTEEERVKLSLLLVRQPRHEGLKRLTALFLPRSLH